MKKLLPLLIVGIFLLSGLGAVAVTNEKQNENEPLPHWRGGNIIVGGFLGYSVTLENVGEETVTGSLIMNIITDSPLMILGQNLKLKIDELIYEPNVKITYKLRPVLGFGPSKITVNGVFLEDNQVEYPFETKGNGLVLGPFVFGRVFSEIVHEENS